MTPAISSLGVLGQQLRSTRETAGLSVDAIADELKVRVEFLRAIEDGDLDLIPRGFLGRSFVTQYARSLGLERCPAMEDFISATRKDAPDPVGLLEVIAEQRSRNTLVASKRLVIHFPKLNVFAAGCVAALACFGLREFNRRLGDSSGSTAAISNSHENIRRRINDTPNAVSESRQASPAHNEEADGGRDVSTNSVDSPTPPRLAVAQAQVAELAFRDRTKAALGDQPTAPDFDESLHSLTRRIQHSPPQTGKGTAEPVSSEPRRRSFAHTLVAPPAIVTVSAPELLPPPSVGRPQSIGSGELPRELFPAIEHEHLLPPVDAALAGFAADSPRELERPDRTAPKADSRRRLRSLELLRERLGYSAGVFYR